MNFPPWYKFVCPFCKHVYGKSLSRVLLGPGIHQCKSCQQTFADHSIERPAATPEQIRESLFPENGIFYLGGNVAFGILLSLATSHHLRDPLLLAIVCAWIAFLPPAFRFLGCGLQIRKSSTRYQRPRRIDAGYGGHGDTGSPFK